jgi:hypothetical protein
MAICRKTSAAAPGERHCRACGSSLADDQLACLECGAVDAAPGGRERRWILPTGGLVGVGLFLVTSASFAATTALNTGNPTAVKQKPPAVAQAAPPIADLPPASGDGTAPKPYTGKAPDLGAAPPPTHAPAAPAPPAPAAPSTPATPPHGGSGGSSNGSGSGTPSTPTKPAPKIPTWPAGDEGYTVLVPGYAFETKAEAKAKAREIAAKGLPAGILHSDDFASLDPGSWVVYIGKFDSAKKADKESRKYEHAGYPGDVTFVGSTSSPQYQPPPQDSTSTTPQP